MPYVKPQVLVYQEFQLAPTEVTEPLRAWIAGPNTKLHRFSVDDEKALINVGQYDRQIGGLYPWPDREAGSVIDTASVRLFIEDALLMYFVDEIDDVSGGRGTVYSVSGRKNWARSSVVNFRANGTSWPRSALLNDRDVEVGDVVYLRGVTGSGNNCDEDSFCTVIEGFAADEVAAIVSPLELDPANSATTTASATIVQTAGDTNCIAAAVDGSAYDGLASGYVCEGYTIEVIKSSVSGCDAARLRITSDSGTDNQDEVEPEAFGDATDIGTRGVTVTFSVDGACSIESLSSYGSSEAFPSDYTEYEVGMRWRVEVCQDYEQACAEAGSTYLGLDDDTYIIEVTKGGIWADLPEISVTTTKGLDSSGPTVVTGINTDVAIGTYSLTIQFKDCGNLTGSSLVSIDSVGGMGDDALAGLRYGDKFYVTVLTGANGPVRTLILRDDLPLVLRNASDLELRLFIPKTIEVTENRLSAPPLVNYEIETTQLVVNAGITAYCPTWTKNGVELPLPVWDTCLETLYGKTFGNMFIEYREFCAGLSGAINFVDDIADIDEIPGQLDEANPLKWAVYRALQNSNGTRVAYTAVTDPNSLAAWQIALERADGRPDIYNYVPLTYDREVLNLFQTQVNSESSPENGNWKGMFINLQAKTASMVVGKSSADTQSLTPTSLDGAVVLATLEDNPNASGTQYTLLSVPGNNAGFITYKVAAGDVVRFLFTVDAFGNPAYREYVVDRVLSEESLLLLTGHTAAITVPQKVEIWHTLTRNEVATDLVDQAQSFADRRVVATWPDIVGTAGNAQAGYFLAAALAGLVSGVVPHQGLTNVEIAGFDDLASRTKDFFSGAQLNQLAEGGIWIATEDIDGTPHSRHGLTTSTIDLNRREEMIRRNVDSMSFLFLRRLRPLIGRANVTPTLLNKIRYELNQTIRFFKSNGYTAELGPQLIDATFAVDSAGTEIFRIHPLAADRIEVVLSLTVPAPLNNVELRLVI